MKKTKTQKESTAPVAAMATWAPKLDGQEVQNDPWAFDVTLITEGPGNPVGKYYYPAEFINDPLTAKMYQGAQGFIDHDGEMDSENRPERSVRDLLCWYDNVRAEGNALKGRMHIIPSEANEPFRDLVCESLRFRKVMPEKNLCGLSIVQRGDVEPMDFNGETWNKVVKVNTVKSVDLVTLPARGGQVDGPAQAASMREKATAWCQESLRVMREEMKEAGASATATAVLDRPGEQRLSEAENGVIPALTNMRDMVAMADDSMPLKDELRRGLDAVITAASNLKGGSDMKHEIKTEPGVTATISHAPVAGEPDGDEAAMHQATAEMYKQAAEAEKDPVKKPAFLKNSEKYQKMAEVSKKNAEEAEAKKKEAKEAEAKKLKEAEAGNGKEAEEENESLREFVTEGLMKESGLTDNVAGFIREMSKGKTLKERKALIEKAKKELMSEAGTFVSPPASYAGVRTGTSGFANNFKNFVKGGK